MRLLLSRKQVMALATLGMTWTTLQAGPDWIHDAAQAGLNESHNFSAPTCAVAPGASAGLDTPFLIADHTWYPLVFAERLYYTTWSLPGGHELVAFDIASETEAWRMQVGPITDQANRYQIPRFCCVRDEESGMTRICLAFPDWINADGSRDGTPRPVTCIQDHGASAAVAWESLMPRSTVQTYPFPFTAAGNRLFLNVTPWRDSGPPFQVLQKTLVCLDVSDGHTVFQHNPCHGNICASASRRQVFYSTVDKDEARGSMLHCLDFDGNLVWEKSCPPFCNISGDMDKTLVLDPSGRYLIAPMQESSPESQVPFIGAFDAATGKMLWRHDSSETVDIDGNRWVTGYTREAAFAGGLMIFHEWIDQHQFHTVALDCVTGREVWTREDLTSTWPIATTHDHRCYWCIQRPLHPGDLSETRILCLDPHTGTTLSQIHPAYPSDTEIAVVGVDDKNLYLVRTQEFGMMPPPRLHRLVRISNP